MFRTPLQFISVLLLSFAAVALARAESAWPDGHWRGTLDVGEQSLELIYHIEADGETLSGSMDVPAQGAMALPLPSIAVDGDRLVIEMPMGGEARFEGVRNEETIDGTFSQAGQSIPLVLERTAAPEPPARPQEPSGPLPYKAEQVSFDGVGVQLAGTLTQPVSGAPVAGVVLVAGAGPSDRDGTFMNHRRQLVMADRLTRAGFAVLRFDERGVGESGGDFATATAEELAGDIAAGADFLREQALAGDGQVGLIAHSEGGRISAFAIESHSTVNFVVLLGAPARPGLEALRAQVEQAPNPVIRLQAAVAGAALQTSPGKEAEAAMRAEAKKLLDGLPDDQRAVFGGRENAMIDQLVQALNQPETRFSLKYDPRPALKNAELPVLALYGSKDRQVGAEAAASAWQEALGETADVETLPGLNHFFQQAKTGAPSEYAAIEQTFAPEALSRIISWLKTVAGDTR